MARVMTTSSGLWFCKATKPAPVFGVSCEVVPIPISFRWLVARNCAVGLKARLNSCRRLRISGYQLGGSPNDPELSQGGSIDVPERDCCRHVQYLAQPLHLSDCRALRVGCRSQSLREPPLNLRLET